MFKNVDFASVVRGKLVMVALPGQEDWTGVIGGLGAKDILLLGREGPDPVERRATHAASRFSSLRDVSQSNCEVAILNGVAALAIAQRRYFWKSRFETILVPFSATLLLTLPSILYYRQRKRFIVEGRTVVDLGRGPKRYLVLRTRKKSPNNRRLFAPEQLTPVEIFHRLEGLNYTLLRSIERIENNDPFKDIDLLVSDADLPSLRERLSREVATFPLEVYCETGMEGHDYRSAPYFIPDMARRMLAAAEVRPSGVRVPCAKWQYLSLGYHLIFHGKSSRIPAAVATISEQTWGKARHYHDLMRAAAAAGYPEPRTFDDLDEALRDNQAFPGKDLIGFYARDNPFVADRYVKRERAQPGLAVFFLRDFGGGTEAAKAVSDRLGKEFRIVAEGPVTSENRGPIISRVRGGNWQDPARRMLAEPVYWFVCWDERPITPTGRPRRKYPQLDNQRVAEFKHRIRKEAAEIAGDATRLLHASDNTDEAIEHVHAIGVAAFPDVSELIARATARHKSPQAKVPAH